LTESKSLKAIAAIRGMYNSTRKNAKGLLPVIATLYWSCPPLYTSNQVDKAIANTLLLVSTFYLFFKTKQKQNKKYKF